MNGGPRDKGPDIGQQVAPCCEEDQSVNGFPEVAIEKKGCDNEGGAEEREGRGYLFDDFEGLSLGW